MLFTPTLGKLMKQSSPTRISENAAAQSQATFYFWRTICHQRHVCATSSSNWEGNLFHYIAQWRLIWRTLQCVKK